MEFIIGYVLGLGTVSLVIFGSLIAELYSLYEIQLGHKPTLKDWKVFWKDWCKYNKAKMEAKKKKK